MTFVFLKNVRTHSSINIGLSVTLNPERSYSESLFLDAKMFF